MAPKGIAPGSIKPQQCTNCFKEGHNAMTCTADPPPALTPAPTLAPTPSSSIAMDDRTGIAFFKVLTKEEFLKENHVPRVGLQVMADILEGASGEFVSAKVPTRDKRAIMICFVENQASKLKDPVKRKSWSRKVLAAKVWLDSVLRAAKKSTLTSLVLIPGRNRGLTDLSPLWFWPNLHLNCGCGSAPA